MSFSTNVWNQLKNKTAEDLVSALKKDGFERDVTRGATLAYRHPDTRRAVIHYHPKKTYKPKLLKKLISDVGWSEEDLKRLKLIK